MRGGPADCRLGDRSEPGTGATWTEPNPAASVADALPVLNSASDRLQRLGPVLAGQLEAEGRELIRMVAEHILTYLRSHDPAISLAPVVNGPVAETEAAARDSVRDVVDFVAAYFKREPADP